MERILQKWTNFLNACFDFGVNGEKPLGKRGALALLLIVVIVLALLIIFFKKGGPEYLPGT
ncbi:MAG: hypothetical protein [Bacteriophage sp.]|nr:MAG: hypothetical protein [Bacteriophage sp.]